MSARALLLLLLLLAAPLRAVGQGAAAAAPLIAWPCAAAAAPQQLFTLSGARPAALRLAQSANATLFLGAPLNASSGAPLQLYPGGAGLGETLLALLPGGALQHAASRLCVRVNGNRTGTVPVAQPGAPVELAPCPPAAAPPPPDFAWALPASAGAPAAVPSGLPGGLCLDAGSSVSCATLDWGLHAYCNTSLPLAARVADLVARLSISDAVPLMARTGGVPRLGLPPLFYYEALHGVMSEACLAQPAPASTGCATSFPAPIALGATFSRATWRAVAGAISTEARALYNTMGGPATATLAYYAPNLNPFLSPLWGRGQEVPSEDPTVLAEYGVEYIRGLQEGADPRYLKVAATLKHWLGYTLEGVGATTRYNYDARVSAHDLALYHLPPMAAAAQRARAACAMCSYNALNGVPMCASAYFNTALLRGAYGWEGVMGSDCGAVTYLAAGTGGHNYTATLQDAVVAAVLQGGNDIACDGAFGAHLAAAHAAGALTPAALSAALTRIVTLQARLGLLDAPGASAYASLGAESVDTGAARELAVGAAVQAMTLLKNDAPAGSAQGAPPALPLSLAALAGRTLALIGPHANATTDLLSNYFGLNRQVLAGSPLAALAARAAAAGVTLLHAPGCADVLCNSSAGFAAAAAAAAAADAAVLFLGLNAVGAYMHFEGRVEGEALDRTALGLPGLQEGLVAAVRRALRPGAALVGVLINGGPVALEAGVEAQLDALLEAYYPGQGGGEALARVLAGEAAPSGRLPYTVYPKSFTATRSPLDMGLTSGAGITYLYYRDAPLWPFGYGITTGYTSFSFAWAAPPTVALGTASLRLAAPPPYAVNVSNTGSRAGEVSALAFWASGLPGAPAQQLFDFGRTQVLAPGAWQVLYFTLPAAIVADVGAGGERVLRACAAARVRIGSVTREGSAGARAAAVAAGQAVEARVRVSGEDVLLHAALGSPAAAAA